MEVRLEHGSHDTLPLRVLLSPISRSTARVVPLKKGHLTSWAAFLLHKFLLHPTKSAVDKYSFE